MVALARPERLELPTPRFVVWCSIQLSYGRPRAAHWARRTRGRTYPHSPHMARSHVSGFNHRESGLSLQSALRTILSQNDKVPGGLAPMAVGSATRRRPCRDRGDTTVAIPMPKLRLHLLILAAVTLLGGCSFVDRNLMPALTGDEPSGKSASSEAAV